MWGKHKKKHSWNVYCVLESVQAFAGAIRFDELHMRPYVYQELPWDPTFSVPRPWDSNDSSRLSFFLIKNYELEISSQSMIEQAVNESANNCKIHRVRDALKVLPWDGVPRVSTWLSHYLGVNSTEYSRLVGTWWLLGTVARACEPGCKMDYVLVLEGPQGAGKSKAIKILGNSISPDVVQDTPLDFNPSNKDRFQQLDGVWIYEIAELAPRLWDEFKAFITSPSDHYRRSYGREVSSNPRRCALIATKNPEQDTGYLKDPTGARRFWPVKVGEINWRELGRDAAQIWAEAYKLYSDGESARQAGGDVPQNVRWWPTQQEELMLERERSKRSATGDVWTDTLYDKLLGRGGYLETDVKQALTAGKDPSKPFKALRSLSSVLDMLNVHDERKGLGDGRRVSNCLRELGFQSPGNEVRIRQSADGATVPHWFFLNQKQEAARRLLLAEVFEAETQASEAQSERITIEELAVSGERTLLCLSEIARNPRIKPGHQMTLKEFDASVEEVVQSLQATNDPAAERILNLLETILGIELTAV